MVLAALLDTFKEHMDEKHQAVSKDTIHLIMREKQDLEDKIARNETAYRSFRAEAPLLGKGKDGLELRQERLNSIQTKLLGRCCCSGSSWKASSPVWKPPRRMAEVKTRSWRCSWSSTAKSTTPIQVAIGRLACKTSFSRCCSKNASWCRLHGRRIIWDVIALRNRIEVVPRRLLVLPASAWQGRM